MWARRSQTKLLLSFARSLVSMASSFRLDWCESVFASLAKVQATDLIKQVAIGFATAVITVVIVIATMAVAIAAIVIVNSNFVYHLFGHLEVVAYDDCFLLAHRSLCLSTHLHLYQLS